MVSFIPRSKLVTQHWYVSNASLSHDGPQTSEPSPPRESWDFVVGGPFTSKAEATRWLGQHPQCNGPRACIDFRF